MTPRRNVAMALDWQGVHDDVLTLLFAGADEQILNKVFGRISSAIFEQYSIEVQHPPRYRNGYVWDRLAVHVLGHHSEYLTLSGLMLIVTERLKTMLNGGSVDIYDLDDFINLADRDKKRIVTTEQACDIDRIERNRLAANLRCWKTTNELKTN